MFGNNFVSLRVSVDMLDNIRYKLCCFGGYIDEPAEVLFNNKSMVTNSIVTSSFLSKNNNVICFHWVRDSQECGMITVQ